MLPARSAKSLIPNGSTIVGGIEQDLTDNPPWLKIDSWWSADPVHRPVICHIFIVRAAGRELRVREITDELIMFGVMGPASRALLAGLTDDQSRRVRVFRLELPVRSQSVGTRSWFNV